MSNLSKYRANGPRGPLDKCRVERITVCSRGWEFDPAVEVEAVVWQGVGRGTADAIARLANAAFNEGREFARQR